MSHFPPPRAVEEESALTPEQQALLLHEQAKLLFENGERALFFNLVIGLLLIIGLWEQMPSSSLIGWSLALVVIVAGRWWTVRACDIDSVSSSEVPIWVRRYTVGALFAGVLWGSAAALLVQTGDMSFQALSAFIIGGMAAGALATSAVMPQAYFAFTLPMLLPLALGLLLQQEPLQWVMGTMTLVFTAIVSASALVINRQLRRSLALRLTNEELFEDLTRAKWAQERTNRRLQREIHDHQQAEERLRASELRFRTFAESTTAAIVVFRSDYLEYVNPAAENITGYHRDELYGRPFAELIDPEHREQVITLARRRLVGDEVPSRYEMKIIHRSGQVRWLDYSAALMTDESGVAALGTAIDITDRKLAEEALYREKELAQVTLESIGDGVITTNTDGLVEYLNPVAERMTRVDEFQVLGQPIGEVLRLVDEETRQPVANPVARALERGRTVRLERPSLLLPSSGERHYSIELTSAPIRDRAGNTVGAVIVFHDVTELRHLNRLMSYQASHDALTGLINRREFERQLEQTLKLVQKSRDRHALCYLDLDQFKIVNDTCGHAAGDELLQQLGSLLQSKIRPEDTLARLGGDEFGLLLNSIELAEAVKLGEQLVELVREYRFAWQGRYFTVGVSIGVAAIDVDSGGLTDVLSAADSACYVAKELGRNRVHIYEPTDIDVARHHGQMRWVQRLKAALNDNQFELYFQPIVPLHGQRHPRHIEILLRLTQDNEAIPARSFIPAAERYHMMPALDFWVLRKVFARLADLLSQPGALLCSINLSGQSLADPKLLELIRSLIDRHRIHPANLCLEITEAAAFAQIDQAIAVTEALKALGCQLALDDFGSAFSSFSYLKHLPVDYVKIEGGFVQSIIHDPIDEAMVRSIHEICRVVGKQTIAEAVENEATLTLLASLGVGFGQGNGIGAPRPLAELVEHSASPDADLSPPITS